MTFAEAVQIVIDHAGAWGENAEESFCFRITGDDSDERCKEAAGDDVDVDHVKEVRDLWKAIEVLQADMNKVIEAAPR